MLYTLFITSFLSATILPFPSEAVFLYTLSSGVDPVLCLVVATSGNSLGGATTFFLGRAGRVVFRKSPVYKQFALRYGSLAAIFSWVPVVGDALLLVLGVLPVPAWKTLVWMVTGKFLRYAVLAALYAGN